MAMIAAKCTQCGANIQVDDTREAGICESCGTAFITEKAINNYNTYITNNNNFSGANINIVGRDIDNYIKLAHIALEGKKWQEAFDYSTKALEVKADCSDAWFVRMGTIYNMNRLTQFFPTQDLAICGKNVIKYVDNDKQTDTVFAVYMYYIGIAYEYMERAVSELSDVKWISERMQTAFTIKKIQRVEMFDHRTRDRCSWYTRNAIEFIKQIPIEYILSNVRIQDEVEQLANLYIQYCKAFKERVKIYASRISESEIQCEKERLNLIKNRLPDEKKNRIGDIDIEPNNKGCYIATCVYGSYDCPQVWTLRRFRDYTLDETWYGRLFIKCYYAISPTLVKWFGKQKWFRTFFRTYLDIIIQNLNKRGVDDTKYQDKY